MSEERVADAVVKFGNASKQGKKPVKIELFCAGQWRHTWNPYKRDMQPRPPLHNQEPSNWAYGGAEYFFEWPKSVQSLTLQQVTNVFTPPWIFLFVHTSQYKLYEKRFAKDGWTVIKQGKKSAGASSA